MKYARFNGNANWLEPHCTYTRTNEREMRFATSTRGSHRPSNLAY